MSLPLVITPEAEADLAEAKAWYDGKRQGLGEEFVWCVEAGLVRADRPAPAAWELFTLIDLQAGGI